MTNFLAPSGSSDSEATRASAGKSAKSPKPPKTPRRRASDKPAGQTSSRGAGCLAPLLNLLSILLVILALLSAVVMVLVFQFPGMLAYIPYGGAFMPATQSVSAQVVAVPTLVGPTNSAQFPTLPPVWTPTDTPTVTPSPLPGTSSPAPSGTVTFPTYTSTFTPTPTSTATRLPGTGTRTGPTPKPTFTRAPNNAAFTLQPGSPTYLANFINTSGCNWFGIVGRAFGLDNNPVINLTVHLEGGGINTDVLTGTGPSALGPGSYQIPISDHPIATTDVYQVQLRYNTGTAASNVFSIQTYGDCTKNLVMVNFVQNH